MRPLVNLWSPLTVSHTVRALYDQQQACSSHTDQTAVGVSTAMQLLNALPYFRARESTQNMLTCMS